jgi:hypothetical protein
VAIKHRKDIPAAVAAKLDNDEQADRADPKDLAQWRRASPEEETQIESLVASLREKRLPGRPRGQAPYKGVHLNITLDLLARIKLLAAKRNVGYQSLIKSAIAEFVESQEHRKI